MTSNAKSKELFGFIANSILAGSILALFYYLHYYQPVAYVFLISEDYWCEYATFSLFFISSLILFRALIKYPEFRKAGHFAFALLSFFVAMEEISWGQRIFNFSTPDIMRSLNYQGEMSFHNIDQKKRYVQYIGNTLILGSTVLPILAKLFTWFRNICSQWGIPIISVRHWPYFALTIYFFDYNREFSRILSSRELAEFSLALAVFLVARDLGFKHEQRASGGVSLLGPIKMTIIITILTVLLVGLFPDKNHIRYRMNLVSSTRYPEFGMYHQSALIYEYIERNPYYRKRGNLYYYGLVLLKLRRDEQAKEILNKALEEMVKLQLEEPDNPEVFRDKGKIFHVLRNVSDAKTAYLKAIELDRKLLNETSGREEKANVRWSMGKTLFTMGKKEAAYEQFQQASDLTQFNDLREKIRQWAKLNEKRAARLLPQDMSIIDVDLPHTTSRYISERQV